MSPLGKRELGAARGAAVATLVLHPVVGGAAPRFVGHAPAVDPALGVTDEHALVVSGKNNGRSISDSLVIITLRLTWVFCAVGVHPYRTYTLKG